MPLPLMGETSMPQCFKGSQAGWFGQGQRRACRGGKARATIAGMRWLGSILVLAAVVWSGGCEERVAPWPPSLLHAQLEPLPVAGEPGTDDLAAVLERAVDDEGFVRAGVYPGVADRLHRQLRLWVRFGPNATPEAFGRPEDKLAYWYNARLAWSIYLAMMKRDLPEPETIEIGQADFPIDGREMTLRRIDDEIERLGGFPAVMAAPCVSLRRAPLPKVPFASRTVDQQIQKRFSAFLDAPKRFVIDVEERRVRFPRIIWQYRDEIKRDYRRRFGDLQPSLTTALLPWVDGRAARRLQDAIGYRCVKNDRKPKQAIREDLP
jgi:hypothetical protein